MTYILVQLFCGFCAVMGFGQALDDKATKFDKITGYVFTLIFLLFILLIEVVFRRC